MADTGKKFEELLRIMHALRRGCPWDKVQTHASLKPYIVEEAYEVVEAIEEDDPEKIREELGDLLFQIVFQAEVAGEEARFNMDDVLERITEKMISRHPHVFGGAMASTPEEVVTSWQELKKREGKQKESVLEGIPAGLPALMRALKVQKRAARVGFDWERIEDVLAKLDEEFHEFREAVEKEKQNADEIEEEIGDMLFSLVNVSRFLKVDPEEALRKTIAKFISRFNYIERKAARLGTRLEDMSLAQMDAIWDEAKGKE